MPSRLAWLDTSERERRKALDVIDLFQQRETRDELGLAPIRDVYSDLLSPGTSTIQTRTRYFLFIPWMYLDLERRRPLAQPSREVRQYETRLIDALSGAPDHDGTIGIQARGTLKRLPSDVYWAGLGTLGIRLFSGHAARYNRLLGRAPDRLPGVLRGPDSDLLEPLPGHWHPHLPKAPRSFPDRADFELTTEDADYLLDRLRTRATNSLLTYLADAPSVFDDIAYPWDHPLLPRAPADMQELVEHARCFSEAMHGAALLYNLLLAEALPHEEWTRLYRASLEEWAELLGGRMRGLEAWDRNRFWAIAARQNLRIPPGATRFAEAWLQVCLSTPPARIAQDAKARLLIRDREVGLKGERSRLKNRAYLEQWSGASGSEQFAYRWRNTQRIVREIHQGLAR